MFKEHDVIVLTAGIPDDGLEPGDVGTIVHVYPGDKAFIVEFMTPSGWTVAVTDVLATQMRPVSRDDVKHARKMTVKV